MSVELVEYRQQFVPVVHFGVPFVVVQEYLFHGELDDLTPEPSEISTTSRPTKGKPPKSGGSQGHVRRLQITGGMIQVVGFGIRIHPVGVFWSNTPISIKGT